MKQLSRLLSTLILCSLMQAAFAHPPILHLEDVFRSVDRNYPMIVAAHEEIQIAKGKYIAAQGPFNASVSSDNFATPEGGYEHIRSDTKFKFPLMTAGADVMLGYRIGRGDWPDYDKNYLTNTGGEVSAGISLPLLRGLTIDERRTLLFNAEFQVKLKEAEFANKRIDIKRQAGKAYWQWVREVQLFDLSKQLLKLAEVRQKALKRRHHLGDVADIETIDNQRLIVQRQEVVAAQSFKLIKAARLVSLYLRDKSGHLIQPKANQAPNLHRLKKVKRTQLKRIERKQRNIIDRYPLLDVFHKQIHIEQNRLRLSNNDLLPNLDLSYYVKHESGDNGDPLKKITSHQVGLNFALPFKRSKAKGMRFMSIARLNQLKQMALLATQRLSLEFLNIINEIDNNLTRNALLEQEVKLAKQVERAERISFTQGNSSIFLVNQRESARFLSQIKLVDVLTDYHISRLSLRALCSFQSC